MSYRMLLISCFFISSIMDEWVLNCWMHSYLLIFP